MHISGVAPFEAMPLDEHSRRVFVESVLNVSVANGNFSYTTSPVLKPYWKQYPAPTAEPSPGGTSVATAWESGQVIGCVLLRVNWNGFVAIADLTVARDSRRQGIGNALLNEVKRWVGFHGHFGLVAETQNTNVPACLLYERAGFQLGGCDSMLYSAMPVHAHEVALFWYWRSHSVLSDA